MELTQEQSCGPLTVPNNPEQPDQSTTPAATPTGTPEAFDPTNPRDLGMLRKIMTLYPRYKLTEAQRARVIEVVMGRLETAEKDSDVASLSRTIVLIDKMNQADEHLAMKLASEQSIANTPRHVIQWTDPPRPPLP